MNSLPRQEAVEMDHGDMDEAFDGVHAEGGIVAHRSIDDKCWPTTNSISFLGTDATVYWPEEKLKWWTIARVHTPGITEAEFEQMWQEFINERRHRMLD